MKRPFWKITLSIACIIVICAVVILWPVHKKKATERKLAEDARVYRALAEQGDAGAAFSLCQMYYRGEGIPQNDAEAYRWIRKAADQGDRKAQYNLGLMYYSGKGVPQDRATAARWYQRSAEQGLAKAQHDLGSLYYYGQGVSQDGAEAARWFRKAAGQGDEDAQRTLGLKTGLGTYSKIYLSLAFLGSVLLAFDKSPIPGAKHSTSSAAGNNLDRPTWPVGGGIESVWVLPCRHFPVGISRRCLLLRQGLFGRNIRCHDYFSPLAP